MATQRLEIVDVMVGLAMVLVVLGHQLFPYMPGWYRDMHYYIYSFHMSLFISLSGFLVRYTYHGVATLDEYLSYVKRKALKFVPYYILVGLLCLAFALFRVKSLGRLGEGLVNLIIDPFDSDSTFLWYIYLLMIYYILSPLLFRLPAIAQVAIAAACFVMSFKWQMPNVLCVNYLMRYSVFFVIGAVCAQYIENIKKVGIRIVGIVGAVMFFLLSVYTLIISPGYHPVVEIGLAFMSLPFFFVVAQLLMHVKHIRIWMTYISKNCYGIYLWHLPVLWLMAMAISASGIKINDIAGVAILIFNFIVAIPTAVYTHRFVSKYFDRWFR